MLYVYAIQQRHAPPETYIPAFQAATRCQSLITSLGTPGSLAHRYGVVLQELRLELLRYNGNLINLAGEHQNGNATAANHQQPQASFMLAGDESLLHHQAENMDMLALDGQGLGANQPGGDSNAQFSLDGGVLDFAEGSPGSSIMQLTGWGQFDSLVGPPRNATLLVRIVEIY